MWGFYANLKVVSISNLVMKIQGKVVNFRSEMINEVYGFSDADWRDFEVKYCTQRSLLASKLCQRRKFPWASKIIGIN